MKVERGGTVHGVALAALKAMLKRRHGRFTTPDAMADLGLAEPSATRALLALAQDGYVGFAGRPGAVDAWEEGDLGRRLMATRIAKRFPAREGRRVAEAVVAAAREANADAANPDRVTWIALFGSVLDADDDALVGDVDLIVRVERRRLPKEELTRLSEAQLAAAPPSSRDRLAPYWSRSALLRRLGRVSTKASLMEASTLDLGVRHRALYAYDVAAEAEVAVSGRTRTSKAEAADAGRGSKARPALPALETRPWPSHPGPRPASSAGGRDLLARGDHRVAQHMWVRGATLAEISARLLVPEWTLQAYLAAQATRPPGPPVVGSSLRATVAGNVPSGAAVAWEACAEIGKGRNSGVRLALSRASATCGGTFTGSLVLLGGDMSLAPVVERACAAAERWRQGASKALRGLEATCRVGLVSGEEGGGDDRGVPDPTSLRLACEAWLRAAGPVQASFGTHRRSMHVEVGGENGARVGSDWEDRDPAQDPAILAEAARVGHEVGSAGTVWTFWFSDDGSAP